jgi:glutamate/tyrosine decarboxylase-like PLP-dependent enzyme
MSEALIAVDSLFQEAALLAAKVLEESADRARPVVRHLEPHALQAALELELPASGRGLDQALELARRTLHYSVATGHPRFFNQLFGGCNAAGIMGEWVAALTNTSMYTYEAAPVGTVVELALLDRLMKYVGYTDGEGVFAPGGSIANLMAVLVARHRHFPHVKREGLRAEDRPVMFVSAEAHYSLPRAGMVAGLGLEGCVDIPVDPVGRMIPAEFEHAVETAKAEGRTPFLVGVTCGTTVPGAFDPIESIGEIARRHGMWLHVDGSYGGSVLLSEKHAHLARGIALADSVTWNPHKMMGVPLACAAMLVREKGTLVSTLGMNADYLFHEEAEEAWNLGDRSLQCGRRVDALKLWFSWQTLGDDGYAHRIEELFTQAETFREMVRAREGFRLIREQQGTNVCFRYLPPAHRGTTGPERDAREHEATIEIRTQIAREGSFLVNYATLDGAATFRLVASNPDTTEQDLHALLDRIAKR